MTVAVLAGPGSVRPVSTKALIITALATGLLILVAFAVQVSMTL